MTATDTVFAGSIPAIYDQYMVPLVFAPYAQLVAKRAAQFGPLRILETPQGRVLSPRQCATPSPTRTSSPRT